MKRLVIGILAALLVMFNCVALADEISLEDIQTHCAETVDLSLFSKYVMEDSDNWRYEAVFCKPDSMITYYSDENGYSEAFGFGINVFTIDGNIVIFPIVYSEKGGLEFYLNADNLDRYMIDCSFDGDTQSDGLYYPDYTSPLRRYWWLDSVGLDLLKAVANGSEVKIGYGYSVEYTLTEDDKAHAAEFLDELEKSHLLEAYPLEAVQHYQHYQFFTCFTHFSDK